MCKEMPEQSHYFAHFPKHPNCEICNSCKMQHSPHRAKQFKAAGNEPKAGEDEPPRNFGDQAIADHIIMGNGEHSVHKDTVALLCYDRHHEFLSAYPSKVNDTRHQFSRGCFPEILWNRETKDHLYRWS